MGMRSKGTLAAVAVAALIAGAAAGYFGREPSVQTADDKAAASEAKVGALEVSRVEEAAAARTASAALESRLALAQGQIAPLQQQASVATRLQQEIQRLEDQERRAANVPGLGEIAERLKADRLLLVEMRKEVPPNRDEATRLWAGLKPLAVASDASLGIALDRVTRAIPAYYTWREAEFRTQQEAQLTHVLTGADQFEAAMTAFWKAFTLVLIDRIDTVSKLAAGR